MPPRSSAASARPRRPWRESRPAAGRPGPTGSARPQQPRLSHDQSTVGHAEIAAIERTGAIRHQQEELATAKAHAPAPPRHWSPFGVGNAALDYPSSVDENPPAERADPVSRRRRAPFDRKSVVE